ncbi:hypothetical protein AADZ90_004370 [Aestuariibius sp. 2305UL40-4]|uniref:hypothetical protein n=1 Tax=Aestuariibius violaceus TaxID=3234132 RepID=UPI00345E76FB
MDKALPLIFILILAATGGGYFYLQQQTDVITGVQVAAGLREDDGSEKERPSLWSRVSGLWTTSAEEALMEPLPAVAGWDMTPIENPWTVRTIRLDGSIPNDDEFLQEAVAGTRPESRDVIQLNLKLNMNWANGDNQKLRNNGELRAAANYARDDSRFNVLLEKKVIEEQPEAQGGEVNLPVHPLARILLNDEVEQAERNMEATFKMLSALDKSQERTVEIDGIEFRERNFSKRNVQQAVRGRTVRLIGFFNETYLLTVWGDGTEEDAVELIQALGLHEMPQFAENR